MFALPLRVKPREGREEAMVLQSCGDVAILVSAWFPSDVFEVLVDGVAGAELVGCQIPEWVALPSPPVKPWLC